MSVEEDHERVYSKYPLQDYKFKLIEKLERDYQDEDGNYIGLIDIIIILLMVKKF